MRADSTISSSSVLRRAELVVSEAAIDPAVRGIIKLAGHSVVNDLAEPHGDNPLRIALGKLEVVDGAEHGDTVLSIHVTEIVENDQRRFRVEARHGLVSEEDLGLLR